MPSSASGPTPASSAKPNVSASGRSASQPAAPRVADVDRGRRRRLERRAAASPRSTPPSSRGGRGGPGVRFVKTSDAKRTRSRRRELRAVRGRLQRAAAVAGVEHRRNERCRSIASGVVRTAGRRSPPIAGLDRAEQARAGGPPPRGSAQRRKRVVVFPFVPGDAGDRAPAVGFAEELVGRDGHRGARVCDDELRAPARSSGRSTTSATAPRATASAAKSWPSARCTGDAEEEGRSTSGVVGEVAVSTARPRRRRGERAISAPGPLADESSGPPGQGYLRRACESPLAPPADGVGQEVARLGYWRRSTGSVAGVRRDLEVLQVEPGDLLERGRRDHAAPDRRRAARRRRRGSRAAGCDAGTMPTNEATYLRVE